MKIKTLAIENFRNHQQTYLELDKIIFFVGHNNAGKSSILAAIEWGLTGKCSWTDKGGRGAAELVRQGAKQAAVALEVEGLGGIVRTMPPHSLRVGKVMGVVEGQAAILNQLATEEERLQLALSASAFLTLTQTEQRNYLFNAYGLSFTSELLANKLAAWLKDKGKSEELAETLAKQAKTYYPANIIGGPEVLDIMEKRAKELRRDLKRDKQKLEAALAEMAEPAAKPNLSGQVKDLRGQLNQLRFQRDGYLRLNGDTAARRQNLKQKIITLETKIREHQEQITELTKQIEKQQTTVFTTSEAEADQLEDGLIERINYLSDQAASLKGHTESITNRLKTISDAGQALGSHNRRCPLAPEHIQCAMSNQQVEAITTQLKSEYQAAKKELTQIKNNLKQVQDELDLANGELQKLRVQQQQEQKQSSQLMLFKSQLQTLQVVTKQLIADKDALAKELAALPEAPANSTDLVQAIQALDQQITEAEEQLMKAGELEAVAKRQEEMKQDLATLTIELADIEILVKALGPDGLRKTILAGLLDNFLGRVNDRLNRLTEGSYQMALGNNMELLCRANGGPLLPLKLLSKSEQLRLGIAIQEALSYAAGLSFLAIDEADMLDQENRDLLTGTLLDLAEEYDQVLVFTTVGEVPPQNPGIEGVKLFWVEDGTVSAVS